MVFASSAIPEVQLVAPKPIELRELTEVTRRLFHLLKENFEVGNTFTFSMAEVDAPDALRDFTEVAAFSLRKIQALHYMSKPGTPAASDVIIEMASGLNRSLPALADQVEDPEVGKEIHTLKDKIIFAAVAVGNVPLDEDDSSQITLFE